MTPFTDIGAAIEEAAWLADQLETSFSVYQQFGGKMEVMHTDPDRNAMFTTGTPGTLNTEYRCAA